MRIPFAILVLVIAVVLLGCALTAPIRLQWTRVISLQPATATVVKVTQQNTPYIHHTPRPYVTRQR